MRPQDIIRKKRDGEDLSPEEIQQVIQEFCQDEMPDYQMSALLMAIFLKGMNQEETIALTQAMLDSGERIHLNGLSALPVDKHSTGGVGDKTSLALVPIVTALGIPVPMISGRALGHSGGTLDKLESIPGFRTDLSTEEFRDFIADVGVGWMGQTEEIAPADKRIYALRDVTATVPSIPLIVASILCKKAAEGTDGLVLDVKVGSGAFMKTKEQALELATNLKEVGKGLGLKISGFLTDMNQPLGNMIGNSLEVVEVINILHGKGPKDTTELTLTLAADMIIHGGKTDDVQEARTMASECISTGKAWEQFKKIVEKHGGEIDCIENPSQMPQADQIIEIKSPRSGFVGSMDAESLGFASMHLGAGRAQVDDDIDPSVGLEILKKIGDPIKEGETFIKIHASEFSDVDTATDLIEEALRISPRPVEAPPLIHQRI